MSVADVLITSGSFVWRKLGLRHTPLIRVANKLSHYVIPFGIKSEFGVLYGWNLHEKLHGHEPETVAFFKKRLKPGDVIADIGANVGYFTLLFSNLVGQGGKVIAFEPSKQTFRLLQKSTAGIRNIILEQKGISDTEQILTLSSKAKRGDGMASTVYRAGDYSEKISVIPLRDYPENFTWAKIDIEGSELDALRGMKTRIPCVLEVAVGIQQEFGNGVEDFLSQIEQLGYRIYFIVDEGATVQYDGTNLCQLKNNIYIEPV